MMGFTPLTPEQPVLATIVTEGRKYLFVFLGHPQGPEPALGALEEDVGTIFP